jgi:hypothetical protein
MINYHREPKPDKPEQIATKAPRHKAKRVTFWLIFIFASLRLGGVNVLPPKCKKIISKVLKYSEKILSLSRIDHPFVYH